MMKKNILLLAFFSFSILASAQKGKVTVGGDYRLNAIYSPYVYDALYPYYSTYELQPQLGYFISDDLLLGLGFRMSSSSDEDPYDNKDPYGSSEAHPYVNSYTNSVTSFSPFVRYYFGKLFVGASGSYKYSSYENEHFSPVWMYDESSQIGEFVRFDESYTLNEIYSWSAKLNVGYSLSYNDRIYVEPSLGLMQSFSDSRYETKSSYNGEETESSVVESPGVERLDIGLFLSVHLRLGK